jgi:hypothetical protein
LPLDENPQIAKRAVASTYTLHGEATMKAKKNSKKIKAKRPGSAGFPKIQPLVAGIDVESENHYVCAPTSDGGSEKSRN